MPVCCPAGRGCNCNNGGGREPCVLTLCRGVASDEPLAALALERWDDLTLVCRRDDAGRRERRFRRRAYERARDAALVAVLMRRARTPAARRARGRPAGRLGLLLGEHHARQRR